VVWVQAIRSAAVEASSTQAALIAYCREAAVPGRGFGAPDPVLDAGVSAVAGLQVRELPGAGVGGEGLKPPPVVVGKCELGAGVWAFPAHD
jgi:hypothetical protein